MRRFPIIAALLAVALLLPLHAAPRASAGTIELLATSSGAQANQPAQRLRKVPPVNFPMETAPRCQILDNFGDPRSGGRTHQGSDMMATLGQEVYAMVDGTLSYVSTVGDGTAGSLLSGNLWELTARDGSGTYYTYAHLSAFAPGLAKGSSVFAGQVLGYVGDTGNAGPGNYHLHFEIHPNGGPAVNPLPLITIPATCTVY